METTRGIANAWIELAVSCAKIPVRYEADRMKQQQKEEAVRQEAGLAMQ